MSPSQKLKSEFALKNGVLFKRSTRGRFRLAVPSQLQEQILFMCHDSPQSGHLGIEKTLARVTSRYWWPRLAKCVKHYVLFCVFCESHKPSTRKRHGFLRPIPPPKRPFHTIGINHIGPFKLTTNKNTHAVVATDYIHGLKQSPFLARRTISSSLFSEKTSSTSTASQRGLQSSLHVRWLSSCPRSTLSTSW